MPWQLIYTSAPRGLLSGHSGFCTVARSPDLREALAQRLEQFSSYHYLRVSEAATAARNPAIAAFRMLDLRGAKYYVLTRIRPCGLDFTARTNHLAHHLVFQPEELGQLPSPAAILRHWPGWLTSWQGEPRMLEETPISDFAAAAKPFLPARRWASMTGDGGRAAGLLEQECVQGCYLVCPPASEEQVLEMFCESLQLRNANGQFPLRAWSYAFTTFLQAEDNPNDFQWRACQENTPGYKQAVTRSAPMIPLSSIRVPANSLVKLAREEPKPPPAPSKPSAGPTALTSASLQRETTGRKLAAPPPIFSNVKIARPGGAQKRAFLDFNLSINPATLTGLGIFVAVLAAFWLIKNHSSPKPPEPGNSTSDARPATSTPVSPAPEPKPAPKSSAPVETTPSAPDSRELNILVSAGRTYVLTVRSLTNFSLPLSSMSPFQNLLHRYDNLEEGAKPDDLRLEAALDRWDFPKGEPMRVSPRQSLPEFSASSAGVTCMFDYSDWLSAKADSLPVSATFGPSPSAFSIHFGFAAAGNGEPFRLLVVRENGAPPPLPLPLAFVRPDHQDLRSSLENALWFCLTTNFTLLNGARWQLQPLFAAGTRPARPIYTDWPKEDRPAFGCELDFARIRRRLQDQEQEQQNKLAELEEPLNFTLGKQLGATNAQLESFVTFSPKDYGLGKFHSYLKEIQKSVPTNSYPWIEKLKTHEGDQLEEVKTGFQEVYDHWAHQKKPSYKITNYLVDIWNVFHAMEAIQKQMEKTQGRIDDLDRVASVGLFLVDAKSQNAGLEMIHFEGP